jgi:hypothetical protein
MYKSITVYKNVQKLHLIFKLMILIIIPHFTMFSQGLYHTQNRSVDEAASWILNNSHIKDIDEPLKVRCELIYFAQMVTWV